MSRSLKSYELAMGLLFIATLFFVRFSNPSLTETELLINYWYIWAGYLVLGIVGAMVD